MHQQWQEKTGKAGDEAKPTIKNGNITGMEISMGRLNIKRERERER